MPQAETLVLLYHWQGSARNFGDELNLLLWPRLLPGFFDNDPGELFLGIGSILDARHSSAARKLVAGAGYGGYERLPVLDERWFVHWVRGPCTAGKLGLDPGCALGDPAMLLPRIGWRRPEGSEIGFMPHFESVGRGAWGDAAQMAGVTLIDPRGDPAAIINAIGRCRLLLSEALHGVIVADAFRVPWVALQPIARLHRPKWHDWAATVGIPIMFRALAASSLAEWLWGTRITVFHRGRKALTLAGRALRQADRRQFVERAALSLAQASAAMPQLSAVGALERCQDRMLERIDGIRRDPWRPGSRIGPA